jgi:glycosyltransferase involved in cell wall biosynthesis
MKLLIHSQFLPNPVDGASNSARALVRHFRRRGVAVTVCTSDLYCSETDFAHTDQEAPLIFRCRPRHPLEPAPGLINFLARRLTCFDVIHFRGFFSLGTVLGAYLARCRKRPYLISPLGNLAPRWEERRQVSRGTEKYLFFHVLVRGALKGAARVICASEMEAQIIRKFIKTDRLMFIPNGIELADFPQDVPRELLPRQWKIPAKEKIFLYLGRLSAEKNLEFLLSEWNTAKSSGMPGMLVVAGGDEENPGYQEHLKGLAQASPYPASLLFPGPVTGEVKQALLQHSLCLLLPSRRESFGNVVLEALAAGTPVLTSKGTPWQCLEGEGLGQWLPLDRGAWAAAMMATATNGLFPPRREFASRSRPWVAANYSWPSIGDRYLAVYQEIIQ